MELVLVPEKSHGNFFEGDCYVLIYVSAGCEQTAFRTEKTHI